MVEFGALFPQTEFPPDPIAIRDFAQAVEGLGYTHILAYEHVLGANIERPDRRGGRWPYTQHDSFYEPFNLFSFMAGVTRQLGFMTAILILPQRQTVLVAKQAATLDVLCEGRLRLGVGTGWNAVEYQALGENFHNRGKRVEEQIALLRMLWTEDVVTFDGRWHHVDEAGLNPLPVQRPIPIWLGGWVDAVLQRTARIAAGWVVSGRPTPEIVASVARLRQYAEAAGRDPASIGLQGSVALRETTPDEQRRDFATWQELHATHITINTMRAGFASPAEHIAALRQARETFG
jgi:probable F420-dependent oxidoreductase